MQSHPINPDPQDAVARRLISALDWCATEQAARRMPGHVFADLVLACWYEGRAYDVWPRVMATMLAHGHRCFAYWIGR